MTSEHGHEHADLDNDRIYFHPHIQQAGLGEIHEDRQGLAIHGHVNRQRQAVGTMRTSARISAHVSKPSYHCCAPEAAESRVQDNQPDINLSTIYRTLEAFQQLDIVVRVNLGPGGPTLMLLR